MPIEIFNGEGCYRIEVGADGILTFKYADFDALSDQDSLSFESQDLPAGLFYGREVQGARGHFTLEPYPYIIHEGALYRITALQESGVIRLIHMLGKFGWTAYRNGASADMEQAKTQWAVDLRVEQLSPVRDETKALIGQYCFPLTWQEARWPHTFDLQEIALGKLTPAHVSSVIAYIQDAWRSVMDACEDESEYHRALQAILMNTVKEVYPLVEEADQSPHMAAIFLRRFLSLSRLGQYVRTNDFFSKAELASLTYQDVLSVLHQILARESQYVGALRVPVHCGEVLNIAISESAEFSVLDEEDQRDQANMLILAQLFEDSLSTETALTQDTVILLQDISPARIIQLFDMLRGIRDKQARYTESAIFLLALIGGDDAIMQKLLQETIGIFQILSGYKQIVAAYEQGLPPLTDEVSRGVLRALTEHPTLSEAFLLFLKLSDRSLPVFEYYGLKEPFIRYMIEAIQGWDHANTVWLKFPSLEGHIFCRENLSRFILDVDDLTQAIEYFFRRPADVLTQYLEEKSGEVLRSLEDMCELCAWIALNDQDWVFPHVQHGLVTLIHSQEDIDLLEPHLRLLNRDRLAIQFPQYMVLHDILEDEEDEEDEDLYEEDEEDLGDVDKAPDVASSINRKRKALAMSKEGAAGEESPAFMPMAPSPQRRDGRESLVFVYPPVRSPKHAALGHEAPEEYAELYPI